MDRSSLRYDAVLSEGRVAPTLEFPSTHLVAKFATKASGAGANIVLVVVNLIFFLDISISNLETTKQTVSHAPYDCLLVLQKPLTLYL